MLVIVLENAPARLRGILTLWMLEIRAGVYVGRVTKRHRERLWNRVRRMIDADARGNAVIAWTTRNEAGFTFDTHGENRRVPTDFDGLQLVAFEPLVDEAKLEEDEMRDWLAEIYYSELGDDIYFEEDEEVEEY